jgi:hypothetical protein
VIRARDRAARGGPYHGVHGEVLMRRAALALAASSAVVSLSAFAEDTKTSARQTAEAWFPALRKAAADKDEKVLTDALPAKLVEKYPEQAKDDGKAWRADFAKKLGASGPVVSVKEVRDEADVRWRTNSPDATWELIARYERGNWGVTSPWAWCIAGGPSREAFAKPGSVKLDARKGKGFSPYGRSAYSFTHVTGDMRQAKNRPDVWFCAGGHLHGKNAMLSPVKAKDLAELDGLQRGGDRMDQVNPKAGGIVVVHCRREGKTDFQVALQVTSLDKERLTFDWRLVANGLGGPLSTRKSQPDTSLDGEDGADENCGAE